jgi:hypothetical protein
MKLTSIVPRLRARAETRRRRRLERVEELWRVREDWRDVRGPITGFPGPGPLTGIPGRRLLSAAA